MFLFLIDNYKGVELRAHMVNMFVIRRQWLPTHRYREQIGSCQLSEGSGLGAEEK